MLSTDALYCWVTVTEILNCLKDFHVHKFNDDKAVQSDYFIMSCFFSTYKKKRCEQKGRIIKLSSFIRVYGASGARSN